MPPIRDEAVVLNRLDYSETSQILVLFAREHGKIRAIAKGIKRGTKARFATGVDVLDVGGVVFSVRMERSERLATLTEWKQTRSLFGLRDKLARIQGGQYMAEITAALTEDWDAHEALFDALIRTLEELSQTSEPLGAVIGYQLALLNAVGSLPRFDACVLCGREQDLTHFSSFEGGLVCRHCEAGQVEKRQIATATLTLLRSVSLQTRHCSHGSGTPASSGALTGAFTVLNYHIAHQMGREPALASALVSKSVQRVVS
jgi:DNA repair protein RecO (recombination protein O)